MSRGAVVKTYETALHMVHGAVEASWVPWQPIRGGESSGGGIGSARAAGACGGSEALESCQLGGKRRENDTLIAATRSEPSLNA